MRPGSSGAQRAARNLSIMQGVVQTLGGIPAMVAAEDFAEHGHDEKGCILFTAFLCHRLLEIRCAWGGQVREVVHSNVMWSGVSQQCWGQRIHAHAALVHTPSRSKEERAAMVVQRHWRKRSENKPGSAREHLYRWIAAASVVQRAVRAWRLRRGLEQFAERRRRALAAVVRLQALWRGRAPRCNYRQLRSAAICFQAAYRGKLARRHVFHHFTVPRMLEAAVSSRRALEASRYEHRLTVAATRVQALRRGAVLRRAFLAQRTAAVTIQAAVRGQQARARFVAQRQAAIAIQASWRRHAAMQQLAQAKVGGCMGVAELALVDPCRLLAPSVTLFLPG